MASMNTLNESIRKVTLAHRPFSNASQQDCSSRWALSLSVAMPISLASPTPKHGSLTNGPAATFPSLSSRQSLGLFERID